MTLSFCTDWSGQTVQTQIRLLLEEIVLLEEQCDQGPPHCLLFRRLHFVDALLYGKSTLFKF